MNEVTSTRVPAWFWVVSGLGLLWNLLGVSMYLMQVYENPAITAGMSAAERELQASVPAWVTGAYAVAVFGGTLGTIGLLVRRNWAKLLLGVSLLALLVQQSWIFFMSNAVEVSESTPMIAATVLAVSILLLWLSHQADRKGWLH